MENDARGHLVSKLRDELRREYLGKRTRDKVAELQAEMIDDEYLFEEERLTKRKKKSKRAHKKQVLHSAKKYEKARELKRIQQYHMKNGKVEAEPEVTDKEPPQSEQSKRESHQMSSVVSHFARDRKAPKIYDFVRQDEIEFVQVLLMPGDDNKKCEASPLACVKTRPTIRETKKSLPIYSFKNDLLKAIKDHQVLIIEGETGSGKTTQIPQYLYEAGYADNNKIIGCTQPRRVAAMSVAARVGHEMGVKLGNEVGHAIRFEDCTSRRTRIKYMTDGMLCRELLSEPHLAPYSVMIIDEAHERTSHTDILFGLMKDMIARSRPDLKLLISSATLDVTKFSEFFDNAPIFRIPGRRFPVGIYNIKAPKNDYINACVASVLQIHRTQPLGDILVFLTGQDEIETCQQKLKAAVVVRLRSKLPELLILPFYANLPSDTQKKIFQPTPLGARKVVLATNIAETSLTIDNIVYVIDPGFVKQSFFDPRTGMQSLRVVPISKASANQRAGRAGRVAPGKCFRLYTEWSYYNDLKDNTVPEIQRINLGNAVLTLKAMGINDLVHFDYLDPPSIEALAHALGLLHVLGALNSRGELTKLGRRMSEFPLDPMMTKMLLASERYGCSEEVATIAAMLSVNGAIFYRPMYEETEAITAQKKFYVPGSDHLTLLNVYNQWQQNDCSTHWCYENFIHHRSVKRARDVREQLVGLMQRLGMKLVSAEITETDNIRKAITAGYFYNVARFSPDDCYETTNCKQSVTIHPSSSLLKYTRVRWLVYHELVNTSQVFMRQVTEIEGKWLLELAPHYYKPKKLEDKQEDAPKVVGTARPDGTN